jgi:hypothetical protein
MAYHSLHARAEYFVISGMLLGFGMPLSFIPTQIIALAALPERHRNEAGVLLRLAVSLGSSADISLAVAHLARSVRTISAFLSEHFIPYATNLCRLGATKPGAETETGALLEEINLQALAIV